MPKYLLIHHSRFCVLAGAFAGKFRKSSPEFVGQYANGECMESVGRVARRAGFVTQGIRRTRGSTPEMWRSTLLEPVFLLVVLATLLLAGCSSGGTVSTPVEGYVINGPLAGASVFIMDPAGLPLAETTTDSDGHFSIGVEQAPPYRVRTEGGLLDGVLYAGSLEGWCESREACNVTPLTTVWVQLMDNHGFNAGDAHAYLVAKLGFEGDPFSGDDVPTSSFDLVDARAALDHGKGLAAWVDAFIAWLLNGAVAPAGVPTPTYTITASAGLGGSISPMSVTVAHGATVSHTITPDINFYIASVTGCEGTLSGDVYTTAAVTADCSVIAIFISAPLLPPPPPGDVPPPPPLPPPLPQP